MSRAKDFLTCYSGLHQHFMVIAKERNSINGLNELTPANSFITNKITRSCIFGKKSLKHVWMSKTIHGKTTAG